jgi:Tfp pilus assembly protein PilV
MKRFALARRRRASSAGFTLMSILIAIVIMSIGLLAIVRTMINVTSNVTQNQTISSMAPLSNAFWGLVQANPSLLSGGMAGTYTSAGPAVSNTSLQAWLTQATAAAPNASLQITTGNAAGSGATCGTGTLASNCMVALTFSWDQVASAGVQSARRTQTFYFQF